MGRGDYSWAIETAQTKARRRWRKKLRMFWFMLIGFVCGWVCSRTFSGEEKTFVRREDKRLEAAHDLLYEAHRNKEIEAFTLQRDLHATERRLATFRNKVLHYEQLLNSTCPQHALCATLSVISYDYS
eukprot:TRINITY_DN12767_c0_g1_i2.p1 TRINITY_DN12767_c0_g1~~TRINITY_DN12767_c0_g1_i2.p1  ORF type:complete len:144 (+),score=40.90 TRINITY_DN12767_c0_g1_i2:50-433(+)